LEASENDGNGLDGFRVHLVALRCDMTSVQSAEMSHIQQTRLELRIPAWQYLTTVDASEHAGLINAADQNHQEKQLDALLGRGL